MRKLVDTQDNSIDDCLHAHQAVHKNLFTFTINTLNA